MRILLVDDEEEFVSTLAERLEIRGFDAQWTTNSLEAVNLVEKESFDLAVLDLRMPKMGGFALKEKLQTKNPHMKFIFLTGYGSERDFKSVSSMLGEEFYLVKPVEIDALIDKMKAVLQDKGD